MYLVNLPKFSWTDSVTRTANEWLNVSKKMVFNQIHIGKTKQTNSTKKKTNRNTLRLDFQYN